MSLPLKNYWLDWKQKWIAKNLDEIFSKNYPIRILLIHPKNTRLKKHFPLATQRSLNVHKKSRLSSEHLKYVQFASFVKGDD